MNGPHSTSQRRLGGASLRHVMIVEDDPSIGSWLHDTLAGHGYRTTWHPTGTGATDALAREVPDLILLDAGLPDMDGFTLCRWIREDHLDLPIILITARDADIDIVVGLDAGASDYVTKPFPINVLLARVRAHLRATDGADPNAPIRIGRLAIEPAAYVARVDGAPVDLRPREFQLLAYLAREVGRVVTRERILSEVWDQHWDGPTKTVDMHIVALRRKLGTAVDIVTVRGVGYRLTAP